ncbi:MAG: type II toxin-antitoxin system RelE/ParE family toxin [Tepidisphaeraceae bacterium]|jgi:mRNA interferase RelE/StbE
MRWTVSILPQAAKQLAKLDKNIGKRVSEAITALAGNPRPPGSKKLVGVDAWRIRIGDWRVIYQIQDDRLIVLVLRVGHRREVYD